MASKRKKKQALASKQQLQQLSRPSVRVQEAEEAFAHGDLVLAERLALAALRAAADPTIRQHTQNLLAEIYLQRAAAATTPDQRLRLLDDAIEKSPQHAGARHQRGLTLWRMGEVSAAASDFDLVRRQAPVQPGILFIQQLGNLANLRPWQNEGLRADEVNTLAFLQELRGGVSPRTLQSRYADKPLLGGTAAGWASLLEMLADPKSAPPAMQQPDGAIEPNPVLRYYQGVAVARAGDATTAMAAWRTAARTIKTTWLTENLLAVARNEATALAQAEAWQAVVDLFEAIPRQFGVSEPDPQMGEVAGIAYCNLGFAAAQAGRWPDAASNFRAADQLIKSRKLSQNLALAEEALEHWIDAAEAWRETVRRRPRKQDHPDALSDAQVAMLWERAAHCYFEGDNLQEAITCLKSAVKYAPANLPLRISLVDVMIGDTRAEAAENELDRILVENADYLPALMRLGRLLTGQWGRDPLPIWRRVLALDAQNADARKALAAAYVERANDPDEYQTYYRSHLTPAKQIALLEKGLSELPNHPDLLLALGMSYSHQDKPDKARTQLQLAGRLANGNVAILEVALHELLHVDGGAIVEELLPQVRAIPGLRPTFWLDLGEGVFKCALGEQWAELFLNEAVEKSSGMRGEDSQAAVLLSAFEMCYNSDAPELARRYEQLARSRYGATGAPEYIDAVRAFDPDSRKNSRALKLLERAKANALKTGEGGVADIAQSFIEHIKQPPIFNPFNPFSMGPESLMKMLASLSEEELDAFRRGL